MANYHLARATRPKRFSEHLAEAGERYEQRLRNDADVRSMEDDTKLRSILQESGGDLDAAATAAAAAGISSDKVADLEQRAFGRQERKQRLTDWKNQAQDRDQKRALDRMKVGIAIADQLESVTGQDTYSPWLAGARDLARQFDVPFNAPDDYREDWVAQKREQGRAARRQVELIAGDSAVQLGLPKGSMLWQDKRTGKPEKLFTPKAPTAVRPVEVGDPDSPTGSTYVAPEDAIGKPGKPTKQGGGGLTRAQEAGNLEIDEARRLVKGLTRNELIRRTQQMTETGAPNPDYDPMLSATVRKALKRKVGVADAEFEIISKQFRGTDTAPAPRAPADLSDDELLKSLGLGR